MKNTKKILLAGSVLAGFNMVNANNFVQEIDLGLASGVRTNLLLEFNSSALNNFTTGTIEAKCGEGKCGDEKSKTTTKTTEKAAEHKCGEGKCGEGKCGEEKSKTETKSKKSETKPKVETKGKASEAKPVTK